MEVLVAGEARAAAALAEELGSEGVGAQIIAPPEPEAAGSELGALAAALLSCEQVLDERRPEAVVLADASDLALAAALAAAKLLVPVAAAPAALQGAGNGPLLALVAEPLPQGGVPALAAWARSYTWRR